MLRNLHIRNLALIREADVDFSEGLNILTGETGAGKSIIIDSVSLALGGKVQRDMLRDAAEPALVELVFEESDEDVLRALDQLDIQPEDGSIFISRKIRDGRSTIRVNGEAMTAAAVKKAAALLIDIHGQSEHQKLLRPEMQLQLIDDFGKGEIQPLKKRVRELYGTCAALREKLGAENLDSREREQKMAFCQYEIEEIDRAQLISGEDEELEKRYRKMRNAKKIIEAVSEAHRMTGYDGAGSAGDTVGQALHLLEGVSSYDQDLASLEASLSEIDDLLNDFNRELGSYIDDLSFEEETFRETEERLNLINRLKSRFGDSIDKILAYREERERELTELAGYEENRKERQKKLEAAEKELKEAADALSGARKQYADTFSVEASKQLRDLNFARSDFEVSFSEKETPGPDGEDVVDFLISTNPGEPMRPLRAVASGGELSRIMLGIKTMFADTDKTDTLIFDEIDAGISGRTAQKVAEKLASVARHHQVLCITHLPQIAAMADAHYGITKEISEHAAVTRIEALNDRESVMELARLLGGAEITDNTLRSAAEMKEMCRHYKSDVL